MTKELRQHNEAKTALETNGAGTSVHPHAEEESDTVLTLYKTTSVNGRPKCKMQNYKTQNENGVNLDDLEYSHEFLGRIAKTQFMKEMIGKLDFFKIKNVCSARALSGE